MFKMAKFEFENHKNQYFSWLLRFEQVKTNIFGNRMTKLTIELLVDSGIIVHCGAREQKQIDRIARSC